MKPILVLIVVAALAALVLPARLQAQAMVRPQQGPPPSLEQARKEMGIPSSGDLRGQKDAVGFASTAAQMAKVFELSSSPPAPEKLGDPPTGPIAGVLCPHDDYLYAGRVYRHVLPLLSAKTVVLVGVFHQYRRFGSHDLVVLDPYRAWRSPDGEIALSPLRSELLAALPKGDAVQNAAMHDSEHSLEALAYWIKHLNPEVEIVPVIVPATGFPRLQELAHHLGQTLAASMKKRGWKLGRDVAFAISSDAVHYGVDFKHTPFGEGGIEAYLKACGRDEALLTGPLSGPITSAKVDAFYEACVNPDNPGEYRLTWCGRFSVPLGLLWLRETAHALGLPDPVGAPLAYATSVGAPELPVRDLGMNETAPANLFHFVGYPAAAYTIPSTP